MNVAGPDLFVLAARSLAPLVLLWMLVSFAGGYLLYAAPYIVVLHDSSLTEALSWSVSLALAGARTSGTRWATLSLSSPSPFRQRWSS